MKRLSALFNAHHLLLSSVFVVCFFASCKKNDQVTPENQTFSSEVIDKWMGMQIRLMRNATGIPNHAFSRPYAYAGITAAEALAPRLPATSLITWNGLTDLPSAEPSKKYFWPANVNAALAEINRKFFPNASTADKAAIDSLETALNTGFLQLQESALITKSNDFGKAVATAVYNWSETDGYKQANDPYTIVVGDGMWEKTAPGFANPVTPYWGRLRTVVAGSIDNTQPPAPTTFSTDPNSAFYKMAKQVYDASQNLTDEQKNMALFWRDVPGVTSPGHWVSILKQTITQTGADLDKAAIAYALTGAALFDGFISNWTTKYKYTLIRPITYIRNVMGYSSWNSFLTTPAHPEYTSAHAVLSAAAAAVFESVFGKVSSFTDHTYDYLGFAPRTYTSFTAIGEEASNSRFFAGIHYQPSLDAGLIQGRKIAQNILQKVILPK